MALSTSWSFEPRAPSTASKPVFTWVNVLWDCSFTTQTDISSPPARAMDSAVMVVERACWRRLRLTMSRSEEHTSELQSLRHLVCRLLLEKENTRDGVT